MRNGMSKLTFWLILGIYVLPYVIGLVFTFGFGDDENTANNWFDYARITDVDYKAELIDTQGSNGKIVVKERLKFDIHAASKSNLFWELWRALPESLVDGLKVSYNVKSVKQIKSDGTEIVYQESPKLYWDDDDYINTKKGLGPHKWYHSKGPYDPDNRRYECVLFYVDGMYREQPTFEIEYEMNNAAIRYKDCSELYISLYSEDTIKHLKSFNAQILVKDSDMPKAGNYTAHTYGTNSNEFKFDESDTKNPGYHTFSFELGKNDLKFSPYNQYIEFDLLAFGDDKHIFTDNSPEGVKNVLEDCKKEQLEYENTPKKAFSNKIIIFVFCVFLAYFIYCRRIKIEEKIKEDNNFYESPIKPHFFRDIPGNIDPIFAAEFAFCKDNPKKADKLKDGLSAVMLSLVRKKYLEVEKIDSTKDWVSKNVRIIIKNYPKAPENPYISNSTSQELNNTASFINNTFMPNKYLSEVYKDMDTSTTNNNNNNTETTTQQPINNTPELEKLSLNEEYYFKLISRYAENQEITLSKFENKISEDYSNTDTFMRNIENSTTKIGLAEQYFQIANYRKPVSEMKGSGTFLLVLGLISIIIVNYISHLTRLDYAFGGYTILGIVSILCGISLFKNSGKYILLTQKGEQEYYQWRGLYNFLNSETLIKERTVIELPLWEQYLIYATAFGISEKVIAALKVRCPDVSNSVILSNPYYRSNYFYTSHRAVHSRACSASYTARTGGYGGYGGGGRGGGGGRRRSLKI